MNNKGYMTIEASVIVPIILFGIFATLLGLMLAYERGYMYSTEYEALYSVPLDYIRNDTVPDYLSSCSYVDGVVCGSAEVEAEMAGKKASCAGRLKVISEIEIDTKREIGVRTDRLRRWQFYDDIIEE